MGRNKILYLLMAVVLVFNFTTIAVHASSDSLQTKQSNINQQMNSKKKKIDDMKNQSTNVLKEIEKLDKEVDDAGTKLSDIEKELKTLNKNIEKTTDELKKAEKSLKDKEGIFNSRLRVMYKNGGVGYLEVLLSSANIRDFLSRKEMVQAVVDHDVELLKYMKEQRKIIDTKKKELQAQRASAEVAKSKIETKKRDLVVATRGKQSRMRELEKDISQAEREYDELNKLAKDIESEIVRRQTKTVPFTGDSSTNNSGSSNNTSSSSNSNSSSNTSSPSSSSSSSGSSVSSGGGAMCWPVPGHGRISSPFGYRVHPIFKTKKLHTGIDIPASSGTQVVSASAGTVIFAGRLGGYGNTVMVDHGGGIVTLYAHNSSISVSQGQSVSRGQAISRVGSTGYSTGPHLHFEVRKNGSYVDPTPWVR